jgi:hypothetical protein
MENPKVYLYLTHGRTTPDEHLQDWGPDGPVFGPFDWVHTTYAADVRCGEEIGEQGGELHIVENCLYYDGMYYGDWSVSAVEPDEQQKLRLTNTIDEAKAKAPDTVKPPDAVAKSTVEMFEFLRSTVLPENMRAEVHQILLRAHPALFSARLIRS